MVSYFIKIPWKEICLFGSAGNSCFGTQAAAGGKSAKGFPAAFGPPTAGFFPRSCLGGRPPSRWHAWASPGELGKVSGSQPSPPSPLPSSGPWHCTQGAPTQAAGQWGCARAPWSIRANSSSGFSLRISASHFHVQQWSRLLRRDHICLFVCKPRPGINGKRILLVAAAKGTPNPEGTRFPTSSLRTEPAAWGESKWFQPPGS